ncbi:MAG: VOC family protein [Alphaproteobacteria bacterium]|jgi:catechol 2,3-dioxygenase-like lactoylglutathione lyase family enzyme|nr:VOC family protein [Alphaproteobacteria bacterium]
MIVPELGVSYIDKSLQFYIEVLGFAVKYDRPENKFAYLILEDNELMIEQCNGNWSVGELEYPFGRGINLEIGVSDLEKIIDKLNTNNIKLFKEPFESNYKAGDKTYHVKELLVQDPDGYLLRFSEEIK